MAILCKKCNQRFSSELEFYKHICAINKRLEEAQEYILKDDTGIRPTKNPPT